MFGSVCADEFFNGAVFGCAERLCPLLLATARKCAELGPRIVVDVATAASIDDDELST